MKKIEILRNELIKEHNTRKAEGKEYFLTLETRIKKGKLSDKAVVEYCRMYGIETRTEEEIARVRSIEKMNEQYDRVLAVSALGSMKDRETAEKLYEFMK